MNGKRKDMKNNKKNDKIYGNLKKKEKRKIVYVSI